MRFLIVDDVRLNRVVLRAWLERILPGVLLDVAENGSAAMTLAAAQLPDAVLLDYGLPDMDGLTVANALRALSAGEGRSRLPIILVTADVELHDTAMFDAVLPKPLGMPGLMLVLAQCGLFDIERHAPALALSREAPPELDRLRPQAMQSLREQAEKIEAAALVGDVRSASHAAHAGKGVAATFGFRGVQAGLEALEQALKNNEPEVVARLLCWIRQALCSRT